MYFSQSSLDEIRSRLNIVDIVEEYVSLKKAGQSYQGLCPFHNEKTPSFYVHPLKQCFHCFGCNTGGNLFTFLMQMEGFSFPDAVKKLAEKAGVTLQIDSFKTKKNPPINSRLYEALAWSSRYFNYLLKTTSNNGALKYLLSRGLSKDSIEFFQVGVSPPGWDTLLTLMQKRGFSTQELKEAGLIIEKNKNKFYDRFRERLMFPIRGVDGRVVGFGARVLNEAKNEPKYINSPESAIFSKRSILFGLYENQRWIRRSNEVVIVEGYMDVIGLYNHNIKNAAGTMGTALTEEHIGLIKKFSNHVVTLFDPDEAGKAASFRSISLFAANGIIAKDLTLPSGLDPDEFVHKNGTRAFLELSEKAPKQLSKVLLEIAKKGPMGEDERARVLAEIVPIVNALKESPEKAMFLDNLSLILKLSVSTIRSLVSKGIPKIHPETKKISQKLKPLPPKLDPLEILIFKVALNDPKSFQKINREMWIDSVREVKIKDWLIQLTNSESPLQLEKTLTNLLQTEIDTWLTSMASSVVFKNPKSNTEETLPPIHEVIRQLKERKKEMEIKALATRVRLQDRLVDDSNEIALLQKLSQLRREKET